jgi:biopolymer transport protein ExbD
MGMDVGGKKGSVRSAINVTPLVDVVLVLLIIFLVTMPIQMRQIAVEVPRKLEQDQVMVNPTAQITVEMKADGSLLLTVGQAEETLTVGDLPAKLRPKLESKSGDKIVFVDFDFAVKYEAVVELMDAVKGAGADKVALVDKSAKQSAPTQ